jgi:hypothetical protein
LQAPRRSRGRAPRGTSAATRSTIPRPRHSISASASPLVWSTGQASLSASGRLRWRTGKTTALHPCQNRAVGADQVPLASQVVQQGGYSGHPCPSLRRTGRGEVGAVRSVRACIGTELPFSLTGARTGPAGPDSYLLVRTSFGLLHEGGPATMHSPPRTHCRPASAMPSPSSNSQMGCSPEAGPGPRSGEDI